MRKYGRLAFVMILAAALVALAGGIAGAQEQGAKAKGKGKGKRAAAAGPKKVVVVWSEGTAPKNIYPNDINGAVAEGLKSMRGWEVVTASIDQPDQGISDELLSRTDVLIWWGHKKHNEVKDELVQKIVERVKSGKMGYIALHSSHFAKANKALMGTACSWGAYKADSTVLHVTVKDSTHPIAKGVKDFTIDHSERYSEPYAAPATAVTVFDGVHEVKNGQPDPSRIGMCFEVGQGKVFYFQAGHETNPVFLDKNVQKIMRNAVQWAAPAKK